MRILSPFGPVFHHECIVASRRWQVYAGRVLLVSSLLSGLTIVWLSRRLDPASSLIQELASLGAAFTAAVLAVELALALLIIPAATAGAICQEKMGGELALMMATPLSDAEIVLGKIASNMALVLGVVLCSLPVLAITTNLGGVDPWAIMGGTLVILGVAVLGVCVSLTFSVWATRPYEALLATYATWALWLFPLLIWSETFRGTTPELLYLTNPIWLTFGYGWFDRGVIGPPLFADLGFLAGCLAISAVLIMLAICRIRIVTLLQNARTLPSSRRNQKAQGAWISMLRLGDPSLDADPVLWREWNREGSSAWTRRIWVLSGIIATVFSLVAIFVTDWIAGGVAGFSVSLGLILVTVAATTTLAEERAHGSLELLLATPLSTREILMGKWWGAYRIVPRLAVLPAAIALGTTLYRHWWVEAVTFAALLPSLVLAYGAAVTSLGLAVATWQPRLGRAVALSVGCYLAILLVLPVPVMVLLKPNPDQLFLMGFSPFFGMYAPFAAVLWRPGHFAAFFVSLVSWAALFSLAAFVLFRATLATFDRRLGRVAEIRSDRFERSSSFIARALSRAARLSGRQSGPGDLLRPGLQPGPRA